MSGQRRIATSPDVGSRVRHAEAEQLRTGRFRTLAIGKRLAVLVALSASCASTAADDADDGLEDLTLIGEVVMDEVHGCVGTAYELPRGVEIPGFDGASLEDLGAARPASYETELAWLQPVGPLSYSVPDTDGNLLVEIEPSQTGIGTYVVSSLCDGMTSCQAYCATRVQLEASVSFTSDDGYLAESFSGTISATKPDRSSFRFSFVLSELQGELSREPIEFEDGWSALAYTLGSEITDESELRGRLVATLVSDDGLSALAALAIWPPVQ